MELKGFGDQSKSQSSTHDWKLKTFNTLTFCDYCAGLLWGICEQGFQCKDCNFSAHSKCIQVVKEICKNAGTYARTRPPRQHTFVKASKSIKKFCNFCRETTFTISDDCFVCKDCKYVAHEHCKTKSPPQCRVPYHHMLNVPQHTLADVNQHHWVEGNLKIVQPCSVCNARVESSFSLAHYRCTWCGDHIHSSCFDKRRHECEFGSLRDMILPPSSIHLLMSSPDNNNNDNTNTTDNSEKINGWRLSSPIPDKTLFVFVNSKSGGQMGVTFLKKFASIINPLQVVDLITDGPDTTMKIIQTYIQNNPTDANRFRFLVCGGDGTVGWVLQVLKKFDLPPIPIAIIPLGTGNDMSRSLGWGPGYDNEKLIDILKQIQDSSISKLDTWEVSIKEETNDKNIVMNNYFSIGLDAHIALGFHEARNNNPQLFIGRTVNKLWYGKIGLSEFVSKSFVRLAEVLDITIDGTVIELDKSIEGIMIINVNNYAGGTDLWRGKRPDHLKELRIDDRIIEVVGVTGVAHLGSTISGLTSPVKIAQGRSISIHYKSKSPEGKKHSRIAVQVDGEPFKVSSCDIHLTFQRQVSMLVKKGFHTQSFDDDKEHQPLIINSDDTNSNSNSNSLSEDSKQQHNTSTFIISTSPPPQINNNSSNNDNLNIPTISPLTISPPISSPIIEPQQLQSDQLHQQHEDTNNFKPISSNNDDDSNEERTSGSSSTPLINQSTDTFE